MNITRCGTKYWHSAQESVGLLCTFAWCSAFVLLWISSCLYICLFGIAQFVHHGLKNGYPCVDSFFCSETFSFVSSIRVCCFTLYNLFMTARCSPSKTRWHDLKDICALKWRWIQTLNPEVDQPFRRPVFWDLTFYTSSMHWRFAMSTTRLVKDQEPRILYLLLHPIQHSIL